MTPDCQLNGNGSAGLWRPPQSSIFDPASRRVSGAEIELALVSHSQVATAAVTASGLDAEGQAYCAFVALKDGVAQSDDLMTELSMHVRAALGARAVPGQIWFTSAMPRTRSGKILRAALEGMALAAEPPLQPPGE